MKKPKHATKILDNMKPATNAELFDRNPWLHQVDIRCMVRRKHGAKQNRAPARGDQNIEIFLTPGPPDLLRLKLETQSHLDSVGLEYLLIVKRQFKPCNFLFDHSRGSLAALELLWNQANGKVDTNTN